MGIFLPLSNQKNKQKTYIVLPSILHQSKGEDEMLL